MSVGKLHIQESISHLLVMSESDHKKLRLKAVLDCLVVLSPSFSSDESRRLFHMADFDEWKQCAGRVFLILISLNCQKTPLGLGVTDTNLLNITVITT